MLTSFPKVFHKLLSMGMSLTLKAEHLEVSYILFCFLFTHSAQHIATSKVSWDLLSSPEIKHGVPMSCSISVSFPRAFVCPLFWLCCIPSPMSQLNGTKWLKTPSLWLNKFLLYQWVKWGCGRAQWDTELGAEEEWYQMVRSEKEGALKLEKGKSNNSRQRGWEVSLWVLMRYCLGSKPAKPRFNLPFVIFQTENSCVILWIFRNVFQMLYRHHLFIPWMLCSL